MLMSAFRGVVAAAFLGLAASPASALAIFDGTGMTAISSSRSAEDAPLAHFTFDQETEIAGISVMLDPYSDGSIKFLIFDEGVLAYESASQPLTDGVGFIEATSGPLSFIFQTGRSYYVGAITDVAADWAFSQTGLSQNGINNLLQNANVSGFASPSASCCALAAIAVSLYDDQPEPETGDAAVPLPAAAPLLAFGLAALGFAARRRG